MKVFLALAALLTCSAPLVAQDWMLGSDDILPPPGVKYAPSPASGVTTSYINDQGSFFLSGKDGVAIYSYDGKTYFSKLVCLGPSSLSQGGDVDQGFVYKDTTDPFYIYFSTRPRVVAQGTRYWLYYSFDGKHYTRWLTTSGTSKQDCDDRSAKLVSGIANTPSDQQIPPPSEDATQAPDGRVAVLPYTASESVDGGAATVTVFPEGVIKISIRGRHSGITGRTRFSCAVLVSGYKDGQPYTVLNKPTTETLTIGANSFTGTASKSKDFVQSAAFSAAEAKNIRNVRILIEKDKSGDNFVDVIKGMLQSASEIFDEAEAFYKKLKASEIGKDVATAVAAG